MAIRFLRVPDESSMSRSAARLVMQRIAAKPDLLICLATGHSPTGLYQHLVRASQRDPRLFRAIRVIKLDEWHGLPPDNPATCEAYLQEHFVGPLRIDPRRYTAFRSDARNAEAECRRISRRLDAIGPIDLAILGLGRNGHLGLNEPGGFLHSDAHVAKLARLTLRHEMLKDVGRPVKRGMTLGMGQLMAAQEILLLVCGPNKRIAMQQLRSCEISTHWPASLLHLHPKVTCIWCPASVWPAIQRGRIDGRSSPAHGPSSSP